ncbi:MAG: hypothetical protein IJ997_02760 [Mycoplasmataceae bacterium]|nr:hypothetical protein [Mycoplasmataceae bacterium]
MELFIYKIINNLKKYNSDTIDDLEVLTENEWDDFYNILVEKEVNTGNNINNLILNISRSIFGNYFTDKLIENNCLNNKLIQINNYKVNILCYYCFNCSSCFNCSFCINSKGLYNCSWCYYCFYIYNETYQYNKFNQINIDKESVFNHLTYNDIQNASVTYNPENNTINFININLRKDFELSF